MKALVVYYSLDGNTKYLAESIAREIEADLLRVKPINDLDATSFLKYIKGLLYMVIGYKPSLEPLEKNPEAYDILFIGTPVWWGRAVPAINALLDTYPLKNKKIALFCCCEGGPNKTLPKLTEKLFSSDIVGKEVFSHVLQHKKDTSASAIHWAKDILNAIYFKD